MATGRHEPGIAVRHTVRYLAAVFAAATTPAMAQRDSVPSQTLFTPKDAAVGGAFIAVSAGLSVFDARIARFFQDTLLLHVRTGRRFDDLFSHINETTLTVGGLTVYAVAQLTKHRAIADVAFHAAESVAAASLTSQLIRGPLGRTRPLDADPPFGDQYDFEFFKGFTRFQNRAFPSIHSSSGFAAASAIVAEIRRRDANAMWYVAVPAYALALTPGLSRMYMGQHWASDIVSGAFLGTFYGWRVVEYSHAHPATRMDRAFLGSPDHLRISKRRTPVLSWTITF